MFTWPVGLYLFATHDDDIGLQQAKDFINERAYNNENVRIVRVKDSICVMTKKEFTIDLKPVAWE